MDLIVSIDGIGRHPDILVKAVFVQVEILHRIIAVSRFKIVDPGLAVKGIGKLDADHLIGVDFFRGDPQRLRIHFVIFFKIRIVPFAERVKRHRGFDVCPRLGTVFVRLCPETYDLGAFIQHKRLLFCVEQRSIRRRDRQNADAQQQSRRQDTTDQFFHFSSSSLLKLFFLFNYNKYHRKKQPCFIQIR